MCNRLPVVEIHIKAIPVLAAVIFSFLLSACSLLPKEAEVLAPPIQEPQKVTYETIEVKKGTIEKKIRCTGYFKSVIQKYLFFQSRGGRLKEIYVKQGDQVKKGDLIAELDTDSITNDIALQQIQMKKSQINYDRLKTQSDLEGGGVKYDLELVGLDLDMEKLKQYKN